MAKEVVLFVFFFFCVFLGRVENPRKRGREAYPKQRIIEKTWIVKPTEQTSWPRTSKNKVTSISKLPSENYLLQNHGMTPKSYQISTGFCQNKAQTQQNKTPPLSPSKKTSFLKKKQPHFSLLFFFPPPTTLPHHSPLLCWCPLPGEHLAASSWPKSPRRRRPGRRASWRARWRRSKGRPPGRGGRGGLGWKVVWVFFYWLIWCFFLKVLSFVSAALWPWGRLGDGSDSFLKWKTQWCCLWSFLMMDVF